MPDNKRPNQILDGVRSGSPPRQPEMRPDHELAPPKPEPLLESGDEGLGSPRRQRKWKKWLFIVLGLLIAGLIAGIAIAYMWYKQQLTPVSNDTTKYIRVTVEPGSPPAVIAKQLEKEGVIRSSTAFRIHTKLTATENKLQAGVYTLQPSLSTPTIVDYLVKGRQHTFAITFLPGDTLENNRQRLIDLKLFAIKDIDAALAKDYDRPLFATKPRSADLEGYIYGETYHFDASATPETILGQAFDQFEAVIEENDLVAQFKKQDLTLYEGITFASIVQREVPDPNDQRQISAVFYNRMANGMNLGSDVTYQYAADKLGVLRTPTLESPYNTRIYEGLPPGPIATPGESALKAIANPANNDYLFFLSGDDDVTYYARTEAEHQQNIERYCQKKCDIL